MKIHFKPGSHGNVWHVNVLLATDPHAKPTRYAFGRMSLESTQVTGGAWVPSYQCVFFPTGRVYQTTDVEAAKYWLRRQVYDFVDALLIVAADKAGRVSAFQWHEREITNEFGNVIKARATLDARDENRMVFELHGPTSIMSGRITPNEGHALADVLDEALADLEPED